MGRGLNKVIIVGVLGREPETRYTPDGKPVTAFSVASRREWITADGEKHESAEWFNAIAWGTLAEICSQTLHKGRRVYVEGHLQTRSWIGKDNRRRFRTELVVSDMIPLGVPSGDGAQTQDMYLIPASDSVNKMMVIGTLGREPELRYTPTGKPVSCFSLTARQSWVTTDGQRRETTEWFNVVTWGRLAEICGQHLTRGQRVYVEGHLQTRNWVGHHDQVNQRTELVASEMIMLDDGPTGGGRAGNTAEA